MNTDNILCKCVIAKLTYCFISKCSHFKIHKKGYGCQIGCEINGYKRATCKELSTIEELLEI